MEVLKISSPTMVRLGRVPVNLNIDNMKKSMNPVAYLYSAEVSPNENVRFIFKSAVASVKRSKNGTIRHTTFKNSQGKRLLTSEWYPQTDDGSCMWDGSVDCLPEEIRHLVKATKSGKLKLRKEFVGQPLKLEGLGTAVIDLSNPKPDRREKSVKLKRGKKTGASYSRGWSKKYFWTTWE